MTSTTTDSAADAAESTLPGRDLSERGLSFAVAAVTFLSAAMVLGITRITHAGVGSDAVCYIAVGDHLAAGKNLGFFLENPLVTWPPLWPSILGGIKFVVGGRGDIIAVFVNATLVGVETYLLSRVLRRFLKRRWLMVVGLVAVMLGPSILGLAAVVQSETIFNFFVLGMLLCLLNFSDDGRMRWIGLAILLTWGAMLSRYPGIYVIPVFAAWLVLPRVKGVKPWQVLRWRWKIGLTYAIGAAIVPVAWIIRNEVVSSTALGPRYKSDISLPRNVIYALVGVARFLTGVKTLPDKPTALAMLIILGVLSWFAWRVFTSMSDGSPLLDRLTQFVVSPLGLIVSFGAGYLAIIIVSRSIYGFDVLDIRLMAPALIAFAITVFVVVERAFIDRRGPVATTGRRLFFAWCVFQVILSILIIGPINSIEANFGYNAARSIKVSESPVLKRLPAGCRTYTNNPFDLYRGGYEFQLTPRRVQYQSNQTTNELPRLVSKVEHGQSTCLVWIHYTHDDTFWSLSKLERTFHLVPIGTDGQLRAFKVEPR